MKLKSGFVTHNVGKTQMMVATGFHRKLSEKGDHRAGDRGGHAEGI